MGGRSRNRYQEEVSTFSRTWTTADGFPLPNKDPSRSWDEVTAVRSGQIDDVVTPNYWPLRKRGVIINNPYSQTSYERIVSNSEFYNYLGLELDSEGNTKAKTGYKWSGTLSGTRMTRGCRYAECEDPEDTGNRAIKAAHSAIDASAIDGGVMAGELPETIRYLIKIGQRCIRFKKWALSQGPKLYRLLTSSRAKNLKKYLLNPKSKRKHKGANLPQLWLEWRYAIRPILFDIRALNKLRKKDGDDAYVYGKATGFAEAKNSGTYEGESREAFDSVIVEYSSSTEKTISASAYAYYKARIGGFGGAFTKYGFDRPFSIAWELTTFSFIVDWFVDVGDSIKAWEPKPNIQLLFSGVVKRFKTVRHVIVPSVRKIESQANSERGAHASGSGFVQITDVVVTRRPNPSFSAIPRFKLNLNALKIADLIALATTLGRGRGRA